MSESNMARWKRPKTQFEIRMMDMRRPLLPSVQAILRKKGANQNTPSRYMKYVDVGSLSLSTQELLATTGNVVISRNSLCPCGSNKRFKKCHQKRK